MIWDPLRSFPLFITTTKQTKEEKKNKSKGEKQHEFFWSYFLLFYLSVPVIYQLCCFTNTKIVIKKKSKSICYRWMKPLVDVIFLEDSFHLRVTHSHKNFVETTFSIPDKLVEKYSYVSWKNYLEFSDLISSRNFQFRPRNKD